jgi:hypothetical protein
MRFRMEVRWTSRRWRRRRRGWCCRRRSWTGTVFLKMIVAYLEGPLRVRVTSIDAWRSTPPPPTSAILTGPLRDLPGGVNSPPVRFSPLPFCPLSLPYNTSECASVFSCFFSLWRTTSQWQNDIWEVSVHISWFSSFPHAVNHLVRTYYPTT